MPTVVALLIGLGIAIAYIGGLHRNKVIKIYGKKSESYTNATKLQSLGVFIILLTSGILPFI